MERFSGAIDSAHTHGMSGFLSHNFFQNKKTQLPALGFSGCRCDYDLQLRAANRTTHACPRRKGALHARASTHAPHGGGQLHK
jgi:hypothetical protein